MTGMTGKRVKLRSSGLGLNIFSFVSLAASYERSEEMGEEKVQKDSESWKKDGEHRYLTAPFHNPTGHRSWGWSVAPSCCYSECQRLLCET